MGAIAAGRANATGKFLRAWAPEMLAGSVLAAVGFAGQPNDPLFAIFMGIAGAIFWCMGFRHRQTPLREQIKRIDKNVTRAVGYLATEDDGRPNLVIHDGGRLH